EGTWDVEGDGPCADAITGTSRRHRVVMCRDDISGSENIRSILNRAHERTCPCWSSRWRRGADQNYVERSQKTARSPAIGRPAAVSLDVGRAGAHARRATGTNTIELSGSDADDYGATTPACQARSPGRAPKREKVFQRPGRLRARWAESFHTGFMHGFRCSNIDVPTD